MIMSSTCYLHQEHCTTISSVCKLWCALCIAGINFTKLSIHVSISPSVCPSKTVQLLNRNWWKSVK